MTYRLHAIDDWASCIIRLALEEAGAPYAIVPHDYAAGSLNTPAYRALNPNGLIPTLETPDGVMFETGAILLYLSRKHPALAPAPADEAAFLTWLVFTANTLHPLVMQLVHPEDMAGDATAPLIRRQAHDRLVVRLGYLDAMLAQTSPAWAAPDAPSVLGHYLAVLLRWTLTLPADPAFRVSPVAFPHILALITAQEARPAAQRVAALEKLGPTPFTNPQV